MTACDRPLGQLKIRRWELRLKCQVYRKYRLHTLSVSNQLAVVITFTILCWKKKKVQFGPFNKLSTFRSRERISEMPHNFRPGDLVFAKMKGYPHWPARVRKHSDVLGFMVLCLLALFFGRFVILQPGLFINVIKIPKIELYIPTHRLYCFCIDFQLV